MLIPPLYSCWLKDSTTMKWLNQEQMDTLGIEPRASRMLSGCDTTTPRAHASNDASCWHEAVLLAWRWAGGAATLHQAALRVCILDGCTADSRTEPNYMWQEEVGTQSRQKMRGAPKRASPLVPVSTRKAAHFCVAGMLPDRNTVVLPLDAVGLEPGTSCMPSGCGTTRPRAHKAWSMCTGV